MSIFDTVMDQNRGELKSYSFVLCKPEKTIALLIIWLLTACSPIGEPSQIKLFGSTMGTVYSIKIPNPPQAIRSKNLQSQIDTILEDINSKMSTYLNDSELSKFNRSIPGQWQDISRDLYNVIKEALTINQQTGGAFDVTVGALVNLWGFGPGSLLEGRVPSDEEIQHKLTLTGYRMIELRESPPAIRKQESGVYVDLSALAKGYGVDRVADYLESLGISNYLVEIGGEIRVKGINNAGSEWRIAIEKPEVDVRSVQRVISIGNAAIATSGDYRNFFIQNGQRFSHTIDPRTGKPITHHLASVSVVSHTAIYADAMATALMVIGSEQGFKMAEKIGLGALFVVKVGEGFSEKMTSKFPREVSG